MKTPHQQRRIRRSRGGFSLVEVTLSIGIISFAFVAIYGLLPVSLETARKAMERTHAAIISQQLITQVQQTPFHDLGAIVGQPHFFDGAGVLVGQGNAPSNGNWVYSAVVFDPGTKADNAQALGLTSSRGNMLAVRIARNREVTTDRRDESHFFQLAFAVADTGL
jgi:uncharacterized protein (TIGR02598 family)